MSEHLSQEEPSAEQDASIKESQASAPNAPDFAVLPASLGELLVWHAAGAKGLDATTFEA